jgi:tetratricopeptide (TPR) repeat protein
MKKQIVTFLFCVGMAAAQQTTSSNDRLLGAFQDRALSDQTQRMKTDERIKLYEAMIQGQPGRPHYRNLLAASYIQKVRETTDFSYLERASSLIDSVLAIDSGEYEALRLKLEVELERHNFKTVAELAGRMTKAAPSDPWNWGALGDARLELGDYEAAADAYQQMVILRPDLASYNRAAWYRFLAGDQKGAVTIMRAAIEAGSSSSENVAWCMVELGKLHYKAGQIEEAARAYQSALRAFPNYHPALAGLGLVEGARGNWKAAIANYKRAQASTPLPDYSAALYDLYTIDSQPAEAEKQKQLIEVMDKAGQAAKEKANRNLALIFADHDWNVARALELATAELDVRGDIYTYDALAWAQFKNGKVAEAEQTMAKALKLGTPEPALMYHAGMIAAANGKKADAAKFLRRALELNPKFDVRQAPLAENKLKEVAS